MMEANESLAHIQRDCQRAADVVALEIARRVWRRGEVIARL